MVQQLPAVEPSTPTTTGPWSASRFAPRRCASSAAHPPHSWSQQPPDPLQPRTADWVRDQITPLLDTVGGHPLLIAKSLGTTAAAVAAERHLPAVWLTPLLTLPWVTAALHRATAPFLLVGGTADAMWDPTLASRLSPHVLDIDGADHGLFVPGPLTGSIAVLRGSQPSAAEHCQRPVRIGVQFEAVPDRPDRVGTARGGAGEERVRRPRGHFPRPGRAVPA
jgi:hypothetical protein